MATILVVDDDPGCRKLTSRILSLHGHRPICAANGVEALGVLKENGPVDLVLLDLMMPVMDGFTFVNVVREDPAWAGLPVIVVSGIADNAITKRVQESGVQGYLIKSRYGIDDLLEQVRTHVPS